MQHQTASQWPLNFLGNIRAEQDILDSSAINGKSNMPDFSNPKTFEESPESATIARRAANKGRDDRLSGTTSLGDYKREVPADKNPEVIERMYREKATAKDNKQKSAASGADAARAAILPDGYRVVQEGDSLILSGKFDQDLHERIKRAGGQWSGVTKGNRRVWILPAEKGASLARIFSNHMKKKSADKEAADLAAAERAEKELAAKKAKEKALAEARAQAPDVMPGQYGPFSVYAVADGYRVSFPYDSSSVSAIKNAGGKKYDSVNKTWFIDRADGQKLQKMLDTAVKQHQEKSSVVLETKTAPSHRRALYPLSDMPKMGVPVMMAGSLVVFTGRGKSFFINADHPSYFGHHLLGHEEEPGAYVYYRSATDEEALQYAEKKKLEEAAAAQNRRREAALESAKSEIMRLGDRPEGIHYPAGEVLNNSQNIYGGGDWFVISSDYIWYVRNNGADGDAWSRNNVATGGAGAIGWRVPYSVELEKIIRGT